MRRSSWPGPIPWVLAVGAATGLGTWLVLEGTTQEPPGWPPPTQVAGSEAHSAADMTSYRELIAGTDVGFEMTPIPGGTFVMGSPANEEGRGGDEGPTRRLEVEPFWMGRHEVRWDEYHLFMLSRDKELRSTRPPTPHELMADAVSRPTLPYRPMDFGMGVEGFPAVSMTQFAAKQYTKWLSMKTGRFYRLPTEAEWEYACRAGTETAYSFGHDPAALGGYAWFSLTSGGRYHRVGEKRPNAWGLFDMHGNVAEWVLDQYLPELGGPRQDGARAGVVWPTRLYPRVVRGGSWDDAAPKLRCAARRGSQESWKRRDPQLPQSIWYHTDAPFVGLRVVRPFQTPPLSERQRYYAPDVDSIREVLDEQRRTTAAQ